MAKKKQAPEDQAPAQAGDNTITMNQALKVADDVLEDLEKKRDTTNAEINAVRKKVKAAGWPLAVLDAVRKEKQMDGADLRDHNHLMEMARDALNIVQGGLPLQPLDASDGADPGDGSQHPDEAFSESLGN